MRKKLTAKRITECIFAAVLCGAFLAFFFDWKKDSGLELLSISGLLTVTAVLLFCGILSVAAKKICGDIFDRNTENSENNYSPENTEKSGNSEIFEQPENTEKSKPATLEENSENDPYYIDPSTIGDDNIKIIELPEEKEKKQRRENIKGFFLTTAAFALMGVLVLVLCTLYKMTISPELKFFEAMKQIATATDSKHYMRISELWYTFDGNPDYDVLLVFFPGYPILVRLLGSIINHYLWAAEIISLGFFALSGGILYLLAKLEYGKTMAKRICLYLAIIPGSFFFVIPMTESMFLCMTLAAVYFIRKKRWLLGAIFGAISAFTRSAGIIVAVIFVYELLLDFWQGKREKKRFWRMFSRLFLTFIIAGGLVAYLIINKMVSGEFLKFMEFQRDHWGQSLGWFFNTVKYMADYFVGYIYDGNTCVAIGLWLMGLIAIFAVLVLLLFRAERLRTSYILYSIIYFCFSMGATWLLSAPRYAIGLFTLPMCMALGGEILADNNGVCKVKDRAYLRVIGILVLVIFNIAYGAMFVLRWQVW